VARDQRCAAVSATTPAFCRGSLVYIPPWTDAHYAPPAGRLTPYYCMDSLRCHAGAGTTCSGTQRVRDDERTAPRHGDLLCTAHVSAPDAWGCCTRVPVRTNCFPDSGATTRCDGAAHHLRAPTQRLSGSSHFMVHVLLSRALKHAFHCYPFTAPVATHIHSMPGVLYHAAHDPHTHCIPHPPHLLSTCTAHCASSFLFCLPPFRPCAPPALVSCLPSPSRQSLVAIHAIGFTGRLCLHTRAASCHLGIWHHHWTRVRHTCACSPRWQEDAACPHPTTRLPRMTWPLPAALAVPANSDSLRYRVQLNTAAAHYCVFRPPQRATACRIQRHIFRLRSKQTLPATSFCTGMPLAHSGKNACEQP